MTCCPLCRVCHGRGSSWSGDCVPVIVVLGGQGSRLPGGQCKWPVDGRGCPGGRSGVGASDAGWPAALACGWSRRCPQLAPGAVRPMPPSPSPPAGRGRHAVAPARPYGGLAGMAIPVEQVRTGQLGADLGLDPSAHSVGVTRTPDGRAQRPASRRPARRHTGPDRCHRRADSPVRSQPGPQ
jgi:hypothetical protein